MGKNKISFWAFEGNVHNYRLALEERIIERAEKHRKQGDLKKAIDCCCGFLKQHNTSQSLHDYIGLLYMESGDLLKAGRHFYFKPNPAPGEEACVHGFEKRYGNDPLLIAKNLLYKENFRISQLDEYAKSKLYRLVEDAIARAGTVPKFLKASKHHFDKLKRED